MTSEEVAEMAVGGGPIGVRRVMLGCGLWCIVVALAIYVLGVSLVAAQWDTMHVRFACLERAGAVDYATASKVVGHDVDDRGTLRKWVIPDLLEAPRLVIGAASLALLAIGVLCLVCAARLRRYCELVTEATSQ